MNADSDGVANLSGFGIVSGIDRTRTYSLRVDEMIVPWVVAIA